MKQKLTKDAVHNTVRLLNRLRKEGKFNDFLDWHSSLVEALSTKCTRQEITQRLIAALDQGPADYKETMISASIIGLSAIFDLGLQCPPKTGNE